MDLKAQYLAQAYTELQTLNRHGSKDSNKLSEQLHQPWEFRQAYKNCHEQNLLLALKM
jgi:hypothetical protein